jgi:hypothetical protein
MSISCKTTTKYIVKTEVIDINKYCSVVVYDPDYEFDVDEKDTITELYKKIFDNHTKAKKLIKKYKERERCIKELYDRINKKNKENSARITNE